MNQNYTTSSFDQINAAIDEIRPGIQADDGDIKLENVNLDGTVLVKFQGACAGCPSSAMTLKNTVEKHLKGRFNWIKEVKAL